MIVVSVSRYIVMCTLVLAARMAASIALPKSLGCTWMVTFELTGITPPSRSATGSRPPSGTVVSGLSGVTSGVPLVPAPVSVGLRQVGSVASTGKSYENTESKTEPALLHGPTMTRRGRTGQAIS